MQECDCCAVVFDPEPAPEDAADDDGVTERHCDSLIMCIVTTLNEGLRNGGGIGDVLRKPSSTVSSPACGAARLLQMIELHKI